MLLALSAFELIFQNWQQLPFTCSYTPGRNTVVQLLAVWLLVLCLIVPALAYLLALSAGHLLLFLPTLGLAASLWTHLRRQRREGWGEAPLTYETSNDLLTLGAGAESPVQQYAQRRLNPESVTVRLSRTMAQAFPESS